MWPTESGHDSVSQTNDQTLSSAAGHGTLGSQNGRTIRGLGVVCCDLRPGDCHAHHLQAGVITPDLLFANRRTQDTKVSIAREPRSSSAPVYLSIDPVTGAVLATDSTLAARHRCAPRKSQTVSVSKLPASVAVRIGRHARQAHSRGTRWEAAMLESVRRRGTAITPLGAC